MNVTRPSSNQTFVISASAESPRIEIETDGTGPHVWSWHIRSETFSKSGVAHTGGNTWDAQEAVRHLGGTLTVQIQAGDDSSEIALRIIGSNPHPEEVRAYLHRQPGNDGFEKIVAYESKFKQFTNHGEPLKSYDNGYGLCQLTDPPPTFEEVWDWRKNIDAGLKLFAEKLQQGRGHLGQHGRTYTEDQVQREAVCLWNSGRYYHIWDTAAGAWVRQPHILCDTSTENNGWDMNLPENQGKSDAELHARDAPSYHSGIGPGWGHFGVCYVDGLFTK